MITPGGEAIKYYASLRLRMKFAKGDRKYLKRTATVFGKKHEKTYGTRIICEIVKSSLDEPYRKAEIYIVFGYGIDDIRGNLQYIKDARGLGTYECPDGQTYQAMANAIAYVEKQGLVHDLREWTIDTWNEIQNAFDYKRVKKEVL